MSGLPLWKQRLNALNPEPQPDVPLWKRRLGALTTLQDEEARDAFAANPNIIMPDAMSNPVGQVTLPTEPQEDPGFLGAFGAKLDAASLDSGKTLFEIMNDGGAEAPNSFNALRHPGGKAPRLSREDSLKLYEQQRAAKQIASQKAQAYDANASWIGSGMTDAVASAESMLSIPTAAAGGALGALAGPGGATVGGIAGAGLGAIPAARKAFYNEYEHAIESGLPHEAAILYAAEKGGNEYIWELIPGIGKLKGLAKTVLGKTAVGVGSEVLTENVTDFGGDAIDWANSKLASDPGTAKIFADMLPKDFSEVLDRAKRTTAATIFGAGPVSAVTSYAEVKGESARIPPTGDPDFDKGTSVAAGLETQFSRRPTAGLQDVGEVFKQEAPKLNGPFNLTAKLAEKKAKLTPISEASQQLDLFEPATQGSLFGEPDVPAAQAEAKRAVAAAAGPQTVEIGKDATAILEVPPQTTDQQAAISAKDETVRQTENELAAADRLKNKRKLLSDKDLKATAKGVQESPLTEESIRRRLREKYPLAFSGENSAAAREEQRLAAVEYDATKAAIPKVAKEVIRDQRLAQLAKDEQFLEDRQRTFERDAELRYRKANQPVPEQTELGFTPEGQFDFLTNQKPTQVDVPTKSLLSPTETKFPSMDNGLPLSVANEGFTGTPASVAGTPSPAKTTTTTFAPEAVQAATGSVQKTKVNLTNGSTLTAAPTKSAGVAGATVTDLKEAIAQKRAELEAEASPAVGSPEAKAIGVKAKTTVIRRAIATSFNTGDKLLSMVKNTQKDMTDVDKRLVEVLSNNTSLKGTKIKVVSAEELLRISNDSTRRTFQESPLGLYDPASQTVYLQDHSGDGATFKEGGLTTEVMLHELAHAATVAELSRPPTSPRSKQVKDAIEELDFLRGELKKQLEADFTLTAAQKHTVSEATLNSKELISYTYTSKPFRDLVASRTPTLWERLKNTIRVMIGLKPTEQGIVDRILNLSDTIIKAQERGVTREAEYRSKYEGEASAAAAPKKESPPVGQSPDSVVTSMVFSEADMRGDTEKNSLGIFRGSVEEWLGSTGQNTPKSQEAIDWAKQTNERYLSEMEGSRVRLNNALDKSKYKLTPADGTNAGIAKLKANPKTEAVAKELAFMKRKINIMTLDLIDAFMQNRGATMSAKEVAVLNKMVNNLDEYVTRIYRVDIHSKTGGVSVSEHYTTNLVEDYQKWKKSGLEKDRTPLAQTFINAKNYIAENSAGFRADWQNKYTMEQLEDRYKLWKSKTFEAIDATSIDALDFESAHKFTTEEKRAKLIEALTPIANQSKEWFDAQAESMTYELLGVNADGKPLISDTPIRSYYRGPSALDTTIITPRKDVPAPVRDLWGEVRDPAATLYVTAQKMSAMLAKEKYLNSEYERGLGKFIFTTEDRPPGGNWEETIPSGQQYGPLAGLRTSRRYIRTLRVMVEAGDINAEIAKSLEPESVLPNLVYDLWNKGRFGLPSVGSALRWAKWTHVVLKPHNYITNVLGAPLNLVLNGNWNPKTWYKGMKLAKQLIFNAHKGEITPEQFEAWQAGLLDSALVGEYKAEIGRGIHDSILEEYAVQQGLEGVKAVRDMLLKPLNVGAKTARERVTEVYAMMDLWVKFANYAKEKELLEGVYKRNDIPYTQEKLIREAGERVKRTNLTYSRAARFVKATEGSGITAFATYQWETYRAVVGNAMLAAADINRARKLGDKQLYFDASKRLAGTSVFLTGNTVGNKLYAAMVAQVLGVGYGAVQAALGEGDDEEKEKQEKMLKAMGAWGSGKIILQVGKDAKGNPLFVDISRFDPSDPVSIAMRQLQDGDMAAFKQTMANQWVVNPLLASVISSLVDSNPNPKMEKNSPHVYDLVNKVANSPLLDWLDQDTKDRMIKAAEGAVPGYLINDIPRAILDSKDEAALTTALGYVGAGPMKFDVQRSATALGAAYGSLMSDARDDLRSRVKVDKVTDERIEQAYVAQLTREAKQFDTMVTYYEGAVAAGFRPTQIDGFLKEAGVPKEAIPDIRRGRFESRILQEKTLDTVLPTLERRTDNPRQAERELNRVNTVLEKLAQKYRHFNGKEQD